MKSTEMEAGMSVFVLRNVFIKNMGSVLKKNLRKKPQLLISQRWANRNFAEPKDNKQVFSPDQYKGKTESVSKWRKKCYIFLITTL